MKPNLHYTLLTLMATMCIISTSACGTNPEVLIINETKSVQGEKGEAGKDGATGPQGQQGLTGQNGIDGKDGKDGVDGINGTNGTNGTNGVDGINGTNGSNGLPGAPGANGTNGTNGYSLVSSSRVATNLECSNNGTALDVYLDLDYSLNVTSGDSLQSTLVACNGAPGPAGANGAMGPQGPQGIPGNNGSASVATFPSSGFLTTTCIQLTGFNLFARKKSSSSNDMDVDFYTTNTDCNSQSNRVIRLNATTNEMYWVSNTTLLIVDGTSGNGIKIKLITFN